MGTSPSTLYGISPLVPRSRIRERLPFVLPEFNRHSWVSELARSVWEPRIARVLRAWAHLEWLSVAAGLRECALMWISPDALPALTSMWKATSLSAIQLKSADAHFGAKIAASPSTSGMICIVVGGLDKVERLREGWAACDHQVVGTLLGYPSCCRAFFHDVWVEQRCLDTTWAMAERTSLPLGNNTVRIELPEGVPPLANILWRWAGVRAVPHLPCRFDCSHSITFGKRLLEIGERAGYGEEVEWIAEILGWPVEWSALHGIAEVKSPVMKISTQTDATAGKWLVQWVGTKYPEEGAVGLRFPYQSPKKPMLTHSPGFQRGLAHGVHEDSDPTWRYADNGFTSAEAMRELHQPIVILARKTLATQSGNVLDLGCGNGTLLAKVCEGRSDLIPYGIDSKASAVAHAGQVLQEFGGNFVQGDLFNSELWETGMRRYALVLLMMGRLLEVPREKALTMLNRLRSLCPRILVYVYPDWGEHSLESVARQLGLELEESTCRTAACLKGPLVD